MTGSAAPSSGSPASTARRASACSRCASPTSTRPSARPPGRALPELLERLGPPLKDRPAERQRLTDGREAAIRSAEDSFLTARGWFQAWLAELAADGTLTRLVNTGETAQVRQAARVLEWVEQRIELKAAPAQLAELAATITGDTKALNHGTALATLVLRALAFRLGAGRPKTTEERRDLWDRNGVIVDDLASRVLVLNLPAAGDGLGEWLTSAKAYGTPFYVTLHQLVTMPVTVAAPARPRLREPGRPAARGRRARRRCPAARLHRGPAVHRVPPAGRRHHEDGRQAQLPRRLRLARHQHRHRDHHQAQRAPVAPHRRRLRDRHQEQRRLRKPRGNPAANPVGPAPGRRDDRARPRRLRGIRRGPPHRRPGQGRR